MYDTSVTQFVSTINLNLGGNMNCNELLLPTFQISAIINRVGIGERSNPFPSVVGMVHNIHVLVVSYRMSEGLSRWESYCWVGK